MGLFSKIFGSKEPAPPVQIHPKDANLVKEEDIRWWKTLTLDDCKEFETQDNIFRVVAIRDFVENQGLSEIEAVEKVKKCFFYYYGNISERNQGETFGFKGEDAKLPYLLKDRANRAVSIIKNMSKQERDSETSMNALLRRLIKSEKV